MKSILTQMIMLVVACWATAVSASPTQVSLEKEWTPKKYAAAARGWYLICALEGQIAAFGYDAKKIDEFKLCLSDAEAKIKLALAKVKSAFAANPAAVAAAKNYYAAFVTECDELFQIPVLPQSVGNARIDAAKLKLNELGAKFDAEL